jgi:hypothetical protein
MKNTEETMVEDMAKMIQEEIDWEIMCDMLKTIGWTEVKMKWSDRMNELQAHHIKEWCRTNLSGIYRGRGSIWMFSKEKDAVLFSLKWS